MSERTEKDCGLTHTRRESALDVARRLGHELPTDAEQKARLDREYPAADCPTEPENVETSCTTCAGSGVIDANHFGDRMMIEPCVNCDGTGRVSKPENVDSPGGQQ